jgi:hypothetical protein
MTEEKRKLKECPTEKQAILLSAGKVSLNRVLSHWAKQFHRGEIFTKRLEKREEQRWGCIRHIFTCKDQNDF